MDPSTSAPRRHERFYFSDGSLCVLVENTLYRVHRFLFETHASRFPAVLHCQPQNETSFETTPYPLDDVNRTDFDCFLACLYPRTLWVEEAKTTVEWLSILKLASKWGFESLHSRAFSIIADTVASPVHRVLVGRNHGIPDLLLSGYASLCQDTAPLSYDEALELGMKDVVNIYRLRYELYGSAVERVPFEEALNVAKAYVAAEITEVDPGSRELNDPDPGEDVVVVGRTQTIEDDPGKETTTTAFTNDATPSDSSDTLPTIAENLEPAYGQTHETEQADVLVPKIEPVAPFEVPINNYESATRSVSPSDTPSSHHGATTTVSLPRGISQPLNFSAEELALQLLDNLSAENFDPVSDQIINWVNVNGRDGRALKQITRMIIEKAIDEPRQSDVCIQLCKEMARAKRINKIQDKTVVGQDGKPTAGVQLFCAYLGEVGREKLEQVSAAASAGTSSYTLRSAQKVEHRRLRLIEFIGALSNIVTAAALSQTIVNQWVDILLADMYNEEKAVTLCLLLARAGPLWDNSTKKIRKLMNTYFVRIATVARSPHISSRTCTALQDVVELRRRGWVADRAQ